jgi:hypothetical protein
VSRMFVWPDARGPLGPDFMFFWIVTVFFHQSGDAAQPI